MARADIISKLYSSQKSTSTFNFNALVAPPLFSMISYTEIMDLEQILADPRFVTKLKDRLNWMEQILNRRKFMRITQGTNRAVYKFLDDQSIVLKVAISKPGIHDSYYEYYNQEKIKPFVAKCFETVPSGIVGLFERANDVTSIEQFKSIAPDVFRLLNDHILGKYVMADIGSRFFRNYGIRLGFGPIILDYPMLYELDGNKLYCNNKDPFTGEICDGPIDYDDGFNYLFCRKCGKQYLAKELAKNIENKEIIITGIGMNRRKSKMIIRAMQGNKVLKEINCNGSSSDTYLNLAQMQALLLHQQAYQQTIVPPGYVQSNAVQQPVQKEETIKKPVKQKQSTVKQQPVQQTVQQQKTQQPAVQSQPVQQKVISAAMPPKKVRPGSILTIYMDQSTIKEAELNSIDGAPIIPYPDDEVREREEIEALRLQKEEDARQIELIRQQIASRSSGNTEENFEDPDAHYIYEKDIERVKKYLIYIKDQITFLLNELAENVNCSSEKSLMDYYSWIGTIFDKFGKGIGGLIDDNFDKPEKTIQTATTEPDDEDNNEEESEDEDDEEVDEESEEESTDEEEEEPESTDDSSEEELERVEGEVLDPDPIINIGNPVGETYSEPNKPIKHVVDVNDDKFSNY